MEKNQKITTTSSSQEVNKVNGEGVNQQLESTNTSKELVNTIASTPREKAVLAKKTLYEQFEGICDISQEPKQFTFYLNKPGVISERLNPCVFKVIGTGAIQIGLNLCAKDSTQQDRLWRIEGLSNDEFLAEVETIKAFILQDIVPPPTSKIKELNTRGDYDNDYQDKSLDVPNIPKSYYQIPSLSEEQKNTMTLGETIDGWTKEKKISYIDNKKYTSIIITKAIPGKEVGYVRELVDNVPNKYKGMQLISPVAAENLGLNDILPSPKQIVSMIGPIYNEEETKDAEEKNQQIIKKFAKQHNIPHIGKYSASMDALIFDHSSYLMMQGYVTVDIYNDFDRLETRSAYTDMRRHHGYPIVIFGEKNNK